ncbi:MAG: hypothetical protein HGA90_02995, partial [Alphaproteobacteria bacterium]|nr:hypothetical protein [Alphaproteobacteria bacterium]
MSQLLDKNAAAALIQTGKPLLFAGDEKLLATLPRGNWVGGTIPYFMTEQGGITTADRVFVTEIPYATGAVVRRYTTKTLPNVASDHPGHGFTVLLIPALSDIHASFADEVANFKNVYDRPLVGWISGIALEDIGKVSPKVFEGTTGESSSTDAVAMHIVLPENYQASVDIVNLFDQGTGDTITFNDVGFSVATAMI